MKSFFVLALIYSINLGYCQIWEKLGPQAGFYKEFVIDPNNSSIVYCGSDDGGGVWKSIDAGINWELLTQDYPNFTGWHICMDAGNSDVLYFSDIYGRHQILKTTDGGSTFIQLTPGSVYESDKQISQVAIYKGTGDTLFCSTGESPDHGRIGNGIFRSLNGGMTWDYSGLQNKSTPCIESLPNGRILAGTYNEGLYYSDDVGNSWMLHPDIPDTAHILEIDRLDSIVVVSAADNGIYLSNDGGNSFSLTGRVGEYNFDICIAQIEPEIILYCSGFLKPAKYESSTGLWTEITNSQTNNHIIMGMDASHDTIYMARFINGEILRSFDGTTSFHSLNNSPQASEIRSLKLNPYNNNKMYAAIQNSYSLNDAIYQNKSIVKTTDAGNTWDFVGPDAHGICLAMHPYDGELMYLGTYAKGLYKTNYGFDSYLNIRPGNKLIIDIAINPLFPDELLISELDFATFEFGIYRSSNAAASWTKVSEYLPSMFAYTGINDTVYAGTENGILLSSDKGISWGIAPIYLVGENILSVAFDDSMLYAGTEDGELYAISSDGIINNISGPWNTGLPVEVRNIKTKNGKLIIGLNGAEQDTTHNLSGGIWTSFDQGLTWNDITSTISNSNVFGNECIAIDNDDHIWVGTYGGGIYATTTPFLNTHAEQGSTKALSLYPNPVNEYLFLEGPSVNAVRIIDLSGKNYATPIVENHVNVSHLPPGEYILQAITNEQVFYLKFLKF